MKVTPLKTKVLISENKVETQNEYGIILDNARSVKDTQTGTVVVIGNLVTEVVVDDKVLLDWSKATIVNVDGAQRVMIDEKDIIAVLG